MELLLAGIASFVLIFLKALQQLNVTKGAYVLVFPTSFALALVEVYVVVVVVRNGVGWVVVPIGLGGALGCVTAMVLHRRLFKRWAESTAELRAPGVNESGPTGSRKGE